MITKEEFEEALGEIKCLDATHEELADAEGIIRSYVEQLEVGKRQVARDAWEAGIDNEQSLLLTHPPQKKFYSFQDWWVNYQEGKK